MVFQQYLFSPISPCCRNLCSAGAGWRKRAAGEGAQATAPAGARRRSPSRPASIQASFSRAGSSSGWRLPRSLCIGATHPAGSIEAHQAPLTPKWSGKVLDGDEGLAADGMTVMVVVTTEMGSPGGGHRVRADAEGRICRGGLRQGTFFTNPQHERSAASSLAQIL